MMVIENEAPIFSIVVCTRNPRIDYFKQTISGIASQTLAPAAWELVILDNNSDHRVEDCGIEFPQNTVFALESKPGFNHARAAGVSRAQGEWIVYVDDDNILSPSYLERSLEIIQNHPALSLFCGSVIGDFETNPDEWMTEFLPCLAVTNFTTDEICSTLDYSKLPTWTAGMVVRKSVASSYFAVVSSDAFRQSLKRCEDHDFVTWAVKHSHVTGRFRQLEMRHLIPSSRLKPEALKDLLFQQGEMLGMMAARDSNGALLELSKQRLRGVLNILRSTCSGGNHLARSVRVAAACGYFKGLLRPPSN